MSINNIDFGGNNGKKSIMTDNGVFELANTTYNIVKSRTVFKKHDDVSFRLQVVDYNSTYLYFGLVPKNKAKN